MYTVLHFLLASAVLALAASGSILFAAHKTETGKRIVKVLGYARIKTVHLVSAGTFLLLLLLFHIFYL